MNKIERLGMELAEDIRREGELLRELNDVQQRICARMDDIRNVPDSVLYESTAEQTLVRPFVPSVSVEDPETVRFELKDDTLVNLAREETRRLVPPPTW